MGLDVVAFKNAKPSTDEYSTHVYSVTGCENRLDGKTEGTYDGEDKFHFRAGSYGGYNEWRNWLSRKFLGVDPREVWDNKEKYTGKPFVELIDFSDCEGAFGPVTSAKLAKDFQDNKDSVVDRSWNQARYEYWQRAFELAAQEGFVVLC
jgi:hypothetical protein